VSGTLTQDGYPLPATVTAQMSRPVTVPVEIGVVDPSGGLAPAATASPLGDSAYTLKLDIAAGSRTGTLTGALDVRFCLDATATCQRPLPGSPWTLPYTVTVFPSLAATAGQCSSLAASKQWVRSMVDDRYLWYRDVPATDLAAAAATATPEDYFRALRVTSPTASGKPRDQFSFSYDSAAWQSLIDAGQSAGYGLQYTVVPNTRIIRITYTDAGSPAAVAGVARGDMIVAVDDIDIDTIPRDALNAALFPSGTGQTHRFTLRSIAGATRTVALTSALVTSTPVAMVKTFASGAARIGYVLFNDHLASAESPLRDAFESLRQAGVDDLILDMRYNGGGYLYIAAQLGYLIGGSRVQGKLFEKLQFSDKRAADNAAPGYSIPFGATTLAGAPLPTLNLPRVFVLVQGDTCSASESVINGLRGAGLEVILIGATTCGKPYGFSSYPANCGTTYFPIEFQGINAAGFGNYADGFAPTCAANDDLTRALGDPSETMLATAIARRTTGACPAAAVALAAQRGARPVVTDSRALRPPVRENRFVRP
jgi:C-terminal processing protease CtpA/Prc